MSFLKKYKKEIIVLSLFAALLSMFVYQYKENENIRLKLAVSSSLRDFNRVKDAYNYERELHEGHAEKVKSMVPRHILIKKIQIKYDTITERVIDSSYFYQLQYLRAKLSGLYDGKPGN